MLSSHLGRIQENQINVFQNLQFKLLVSAEAQYLNKKNTFKSAIKSFNTNICFFKKMGHPRPLFRLFSVFSNKHYLFYNKLMWKNVYLVSGAGIWTHNLLILSLLL